MILLVSDTSILIDLERGDLLAMAFASGITMLVPDLLYEKELEPYNGAYFRALGLQVVALQPEKVSFAQRIKNERKPLSLPDCFALSCERRPDHVLLTSDGPLRKRQPKITGWKCMDCYGCWMAWLKAAR